jgi:hypothetical protein
MAHEQQQEESLQDSSVENRVAKQEKTDSWQTIGVLASLLFGIWGAGLSTWQYYESKIRDSPIIYGQLTVSKLRSSSSIHEITLKIHNAGVNTITLEPRMQIIMLAPNGNFVPNSYIEPQFSIDGDGDDETVQAPLPLSIDPGKSGVMKKTVSSSSDLFRQEVQYTIIIRDSRHERYRETFSRTRVTFGNRNKVSMAFESRPLIRL